MFLKLISTRTYASTVDPHVHYIPLFDLKAVCPVQVNKAHKSTTFSPHFYTHPILTGKKLRLTCFFPGYATSRS